MSKIYGHRHIHISIILSIIILISIMTGCGESGSPGFGRDRDSEAYTLDSLWTDYSMIVAGQWTNVYALVVGDTSGIPKADVSVEFEVDVGDLDNHTAETGDDGIASTVLHTTLADSVYNSITITALTYSRDQKDTTRRIHNITILSPNYQDPTYITLSANPDTIYADGSSRVDLVASVRNEAHIGLEGHQVYLSFVEGDLGDLDLNIEENNPISDAEGNVEAHFISPSTTPREIKVEAKVYGISDTVADTATIQVLAIPEVSMIDLRAEPTSIEADGASELTLSAYVTIGGTGTIAPDGTEILFTSESGTLVPIAGVKTSSSSTTIKSRRSKYKAIDAIRKPGSADPRFRPNSSITAYTNSGYAMVKLRSSTTAGRYECTASADIGTTGTIADTVNVNFTAGAPMTIMLEPARPSILADGEDTTLITATIYDENMNPVGSGYTVDFITDIGSVYPVTSTTDTLGQATTVITSSVTSGYARVEATCGSAWNYTQVLFTSTVPRFIQLNASPAQLTADGTSQSALTAEVWDSSYTHVTDGVRIKFYSSLGELSSSSSVRSGLLSGKSSYITLTADTYQSMVSDGFALASLTSGYVADSCLVAAWFEMVDSLGDTTITAADTVYLIFNPGSPNRLEVSFSRDSILADGEDTSVVWADVYDAHDNLVNSGISVTFETETGGGTVNPPSSNTNAAGRAQTRLTSSRNVGWHTITATTPGAIPGSDVIYFYPILPTDLRMDHDYDSATANGSDRVRIMVTVFDDDFRPCSDGTPVYFRSDMGTFMPVTSRSFAGETDTKLSTSKITSAREIPGIRIPHSDSRERPDIRSMTEGGSPSFEHFMVFDSFMVPTGVPFADGVAEIDLIAPTTIGSTWVYADVATSDSTWARDSMKIKFVPDVPSRIVLTAEPDTIPADSSSESMISAYVTDAHHNPVGPGYFVQFVMASGSDTYGWIVVPTDPTDDSSYASSRFRSYYTAGEAVITADVAGYPSASENVSVWLTGASAGNVILSMDSVRIHIGKTMNITASVYDIMGDPITDGTHVNFTVVSDEMGTVNPPSPSTSGGTAEAEFSPDTIAGSCLVIATVGSVADTKSVQILPGEIATIDLQVVPDTLPADGVSNANAIARCYDTYGNAAEEGSNVSFGTDLGSIDTSATTDTLGQATATYTAGVTIGTAHIQASAGIAPTTTATCELIGSDPQTLILTADSSHIAIDGNQLALTAYCLDGLGHPISDGTQIDFSSALGDFTTLFEFTVDGFVYTNLISGTEAGFDTVIAMTHDSTVSDTLIIRYDAGPANYIDLSASPETLAADGRARSTITALCTDLYGNPISAGKFVTFISDLGSIISPTTTDSTGQAQTEYTANEEVGPVRIDATIDVAHSWIYLEQIATPAAFITVSASPNRVTANGIDSCQVVARVLDEAASPVPDGTIVYFRNMNTADSTTIGDMDTFAVTTGGDAIVWWKAPTYTAQAVVYGNVYGLQDSALVEFIPGEAAGISIDSITPSDTIPADGETRANVFARVFDEYGSPVQGTEVAFGVSPYGTFVFDRTNTDSLGQAKAQLYSEDAGNATIMASAAGYTDYAEIYFSPTVAENIFLTADTVELVANGLSTTTIRAFVVDSASAAVPDNTPIHFTTDLGFVFPGIGYTTDGEASTILRSTTTVGTATITGDAGYGVTNTTTVDFIPGPPARIVANALPNTIPADGDTFTTIQALVYDANNNLVRAGVKVNFTTTMGSIDSSSYTNALGEATVYLTAGHTPGTAVVWASSGTALAQTTVNFTSTDAEYLFLYIDPSEVIADGRQTAEVTGRVTDADGSPVSDGTPVTLSVTTDSAGPYGSISPITVHTDSGEFAATFTSDRNSGIANIIADVTSTLVGSVRVELLPGPADSIYVEADPTTLPADSFSTSDIHVKVFDQFANPVQAGDTVRFEANLGTIDPTTETTNSSGHADAVFTAGRTVGEARIRVSSGDAHEEAFIQLERSEITYVDVTLDTSRLMADGLSSTFVRATVSDSFGNPVSDGTPVRFSIDTLTGSPDDTSKASLSPIIGFTTDGEAVVQVRSDTITGRIWVQACTNDSSCGSAHLDLVPGPVDSIEAWVDDDALPANGEAFTIVHVRLRDRYGNLLGAGTEVNFLTTGGTISPTSTYTNSSGQADAILTAGTVPTLARVEITCGGRFAVVEVALDIAPPAYLSLRALPRRIAADGETYLEVTAKVLNELGQPINNGTIVVFHSVDDTGLTYGSIDTLATTTDGEATVRLYSEPTTGTAHVSARVADSLSDTVEVIFTPGPPFRVEMEAIPTNVLYANGASICTVRTSVFDEYDNLVESGERIDYTVGPDPSLGSMFPTYTYTDMANPSDVSFQSGVDVGRAVVTGTVVGGPSGSTIIDLIPLTVETIDIYSDSLRLTADGASQTAIHALVLDTTGVGVSDSTPIYFTTSAGNIFPGVAYTNSGEAEVTLRAGSEVDTAMIIAFVGDPADTYYVADTNYVSFVPGEPSIIEVVPDSNTLIADGESRSDIRVYIFDPLGNRVAPGHLVSFTTTLGEIDSLAVTEVVNGTTGVAITSLRSGILPGTALISASSGDALDIGRVDFIPSNVGEVFVVIDPDMLVADGRATGTITGMVRNTLGNPISDGTPVHLFDIPDSSGTDLGDISPLTAYTDSGSFSSSMTARTKTGNIQIVAYVGDTASSYISDTTRCELIPGEPDSINVYPDSLTLPADSFSTTPIHAEVLDRFGNTVDGGITVNFSTTKGDIYPASDVTNSSGEIVVYLRSSFEVGTARIIARTGEARGETEVQFDPTDVFTVALSIDDRIMQADGYSETACRATVLDTLGNPISDGTAVIFSMWPDTIFDTLLDPSDTLGALIPSVAYTYSGDASTNFRVQTQRGRVWIRASVDTVYDEAFIDIRPGELTSIDISATPDTLSANGRDEALITANLLDDYGNSLLSGHTVSFGTDMGEIAPTSTYSNSAGRAYCNLTASTEPGVARVFAQCEGIFELTEVTFQESNVGVLLLTADPVELTADGMSQSVITCQVFDTEGSPVSDGTEVSFEVHPADTAGVVVSPKLTAGGNCVTIFTSSTEVGDGDAWVVASATFDSAGTPVVRTDSVRIFLIPGPPASIEVWADSSDTVDIGLDSIWADGSDNVFIYARVLDQYDNHMKAGTDVTFETNLGSIIPSAITDTSGVARSLLTAGIEQGDAVLQVRAGSSAGYHQVHMAPTDIDNVILMADTTELIADGTNTTNLYAYVYSTGGRLVSDGTQVTFVDTSGYTHPQPSIEYTDSGVATITLRADTIANPGVEVWAIAGSDTGKITIRLNAGEPSRLDAYASADSIYADGASNVAIACTVYDRFSNPVLPGTPVSFSTTLGEIIPSGFTNTQGYAYSRLTAGTDYGEALVTVRAADAIDFVTVLFDSLIADEIVLNIVPSRLPGDGTSTSEITAWVYNADGLPVSDNTRVTFTQDTTGGKPVGIITPRIAFTEGGIAEATLTAPVDVGQGLVIAGVGATVADSMGVTYIPGDPATIEFDTTYSDSLPADGAGYEVVVRVYDAYNNPVNVGTEVTFETTRGEILSPSVVEDDSGTARSLVSSMETGPSLITARSGVAVAGRAYYFYALTADIIDLVANPIRILADGSSESNLIATVIDTTGGIRPVSNNTPVFFESRGGGVVTPRTAYTLDGQVTATFIAGVTTGPDTIIATVSASVEDTVIVDMIAGPPAIVDFQEPINNMYANGADTQTVWVEVTDAFGNAVDPGLPISFNTSIGDITPLSATNDSGYGSAVIVSGAEFGTASITATCQGVSGYATLSFLPMIAESLVLVVDPPTITANGSDEAELTAVVFDTASMPVSDGTLVRFATSAGIITPAVAYTSGGIATSTLRASTTPFDTVTVVASAGTLAIDTSYATFEPGPPAVMYISASDSTLLANNSDTTRILVEVKDQFGNSVGAGVTVDFDATLGTITPVAYTDSLGKASVRLISGTESGFSAVNASAGDAEANILIEIFNTEVAQILLTVIPAELVADGISEAEVTVNVLDTAGNPISDVTTLRFGGMNLGSISPIFTTTTAGEANATIRSYLEVGVDTLFAYSGDSSASTEIRFVSGPPAYILMYPADSSLMANETDTTTIFAEVVDEAGNPVGAGKIVNFNITPTGYGSIWGTAATDDSGRVEVPFMAGRYSGVAIINATCEGANGVTQVELIPTDVAEIGINIIPRYLPADGISIAEVTAFVIDSAGLEIADGTGVRFAQDTSRSSVTGLLNPNWETTIDGEAQIDLIAPTVAGSTFVYAYIDTIFSDTMSVYFEPGEVSVVRFDTSYVRLYADGVDTIADSVWVEDAFGNGIEGATINFTLPNGTIVPEIGVSNPDGGIRFKVTSPNKIGSTYLTASSGGISGYLPIDYIPTAVDTILMTITPRGLPADGSSNADVFVTVLDSLGNPVSDGEVVRFTAKMGLISPVDSLVTGNATAILVAADTSGIDTIKAICQNDTAIVTVTYSAGAPADLVLNVSPDTATVGSSISSRVSGVVLDASDNPVAPGTYVYIEVDSALMGSVADPVVATDDTGAYYTTYTPGLKAGLTGITATVGDLTAHRDILLKAGAPHTMDIAVSRDFIYVRGVGEVDQSVVEAVIYDEYDNPVRDSSAVIFEVVLYPTGGSVNPTLTPAHPTLPLHSDTVYTIGGRASVAARSGDKSGSMVVEARAIISGGGVLDSRAPRITIGSGLPNYVSISAEDCNVRGWDVDGVPNGVGVIVTDSNENPVAPGTAVWFYAEEGAITTSSVTDDSGFAYATWYSSDPRNDGIVWLFAETRDTSRIITDSVYFYSSGPADSMDISVAPDITFADTSGFSDVQVNVWDVNGLPVADSTSIVLVTDWGSVTSPIKTGNECYNSYAISRYTGRNLFEDGYCAQDTGGFAKVSANIAGLSATDTVFLKHGSPNSDNSTVSAPTSVPVLATFPVSAQVVDQWNNPICGEQVTLDILSGTVIGSATQTTGVTGEATWTCQAPDSLAPETDVIIATISSTGGTFFAEISYVSRRRPSPPAEEAEKIPGPIKEANRSEIFFIKED